MGLVCNKEFNEKQGVYGIIGAGYPSIDKRIFIFMLESRTLIAPVVARSKSNPDKVILVFISEDGNEEHITAKQFHLGAVRYGQIFDRFGIKSDDLVILVLQHSKELLFAFWGALYTGAIPSIFPFLTEKLDPELYRARIKKLVANSGARTVITYPDFYADLSALLVETGCQVLSTAVIVADDTDGQIEEGRGELGGEKIAFLQHSSGTTGLQKGVALSHRSELPVENCPTKNCCFSAPARLALALPTFLSLPWWKTA